MNTSKKCNVFKRFAYSFVPSKYGVLAYQSAGSTFLFMLILTLIMAFSLTGNIFYVMNQTLQETLGVGSIGEVIEKYVPDFTIENGKLDLDEPINYTIDTVCIYIDSDVEELSLSDMDYLLNNSGFEGIILGSKKNCFVYNKRTGEMQTLNFSDFGNMKVGKQDLVDLVYEWTSFGKIGPALIIIYLIYFIVLYAVLALGCCVVFVILNLFLHRNVRAGKAYAIGVYALVPSFLLSQLLAWLPISIPSELTNPVYVILTVVLGCFGLYSVHDMAILENEEKYKYKYEQNPYRISGVMPGDTAAMSDDAFGGYASADVAKPSYHAVNGNIKVRLKGIEVEHSALELINKYVKGNLKDLAVQQLGEVTGLNILDCREIIDEWDRYYY